MIDINIVESEKKVYVSVSGYITSKQASEFMNNYKRIARNIKGSQYKLVVNPSVFECENNKDIKDVCMSFFKTGYKKMYLVDPNKQLVNSMSLGSMEKKLFFKSVKVINTIDEAK